MFEYTTNMGKKVTINPKAIVSITEENCNPGQCYILLINDFYIVNKPYNEVKQEYERFMYSIQCIISV